MDNAINFQSFNCYPLAIQISYLYYKHWCNKDEQWYISHGFDITALKKKDDPYTEQLKATIRKNKYTVFIAATTQIPWIEEIIKQYSMEDWVFYRQPEACFNAGYEDGGRLRTYIFKEPV